jgi:hypothetical protein
MVGLNEAMQDIGTSGNPEPPRALSAQSLEVFSRHLAALPVGDELEAHLTDLRARKNTRTIYNFT